MKKNKFLFPLDNLQLFAEDDPGTGANDTDNQENESHEGESENENQQPKTFTQEELDKIVQGRIAKERKSWEKHLEDQKTEAEKLAGMSEKEKKEYQAKKRQDDLDAREAAITQRELTAQAKVQLADKGIPTELAEILNFTDADSCKKSIETVEKAFQSAVEKAVDERLKGGKPPKRAKDDTPSEADLIYKNMMGK